jgi:plastocyanin
VKPSWKCVYAVSVLAICVAAAGFFAKASGREEGARAAAPVQIKIDNFAFSPIELKVAPGTTVEWVNHDDIPHTVVSDDKTTFKSKALDTDDKFSYTFTKPGIYPYFCSIHPKMTGKIVVE